MRDTPHPSSGSPHSDLSNRLITAKQLADLLAVSERTVWRLDSAGKLPLPIRVGGSVRWRNSEIQRWLLAKCPDRKTWEEMERKRNQDQQL